jgi:hypothetical protein
MHGERTSEAFRYWRKLLLPGVAILCRTSLSLSIALLRRPIFMVIFVESCAAPFRAQPFGTSPRDSCGTSLVLCAAEVGEVWAAEVDVGAACVSVVRVKCAVGMLIELLNSASLPAPLDVELGKIPETVLGDHVRSAWKRTAVSAATAITVAVVEAMPRREQR